MAASTSLSDLVIERPGESLAKRFTRGIPDFDHRLTQRLIAHLVGAGARVIEDRSSPACRIVRLEGPRRDRLALRSYPNRTLQIDGIHGELVHWALDFLRTTMPLDRILAQQVEIYRLPLSIAEAKGLLAAQAPTADHVVAPEVAVQLISAIALCKIDIALPDYAALAFPALRGLEGFCFQVLRNECGLKPTARHRLGDYFEPMGARFSLRSIYAKTVPDTQRQILDRCYHLWHSERHGLFHLGAALVGARILEERAEAIDLVTRVLSMIEDSCHRLLKGMQ